jgi:hypothetical protein
MNENGLRMSLHGGGPAKPRSGKPHDAYRTVLAEGLPRGFRHFALKGRFRPAATGNRQAMAERYARLAARMTARLDWEKAPPRQPGLDDPIEKERPDIRDNPYLPSGYTYLLQFIAHDMVSTRVPFWATTTLDQETANDRDRRLVLDALYGDGPHALRMIYAPDSADDLNRTKLQIGRSGPVRTGDGISLCPFRDVARMRLSQTLTDLPGVTEPLIADPRNDDHPLISQLTMIFAHLHNIFVDLQGPGQTDVSTLDFTTDAAKRFALAREATTLVYRHIIRDDLLKRLLHPSVHALYSTGTPPFLDAIGGARTAGVPLEFSHAAFRFGHAMLRDSYHINASTPAFGQFIKDGLNRFSSSGNTRMEPMPATWLVQWSNFFNFPGITEPDRINLSRRIGPATPLSVAAPVLGPIDPSSGAGIFYRDLISGELANLWPVQDLLAAMRDHEALAPIVNASALLRDDIWQNEVMLWLGGGDFQGAAQPWDGLSDEVQEDDLAALSIDPPLLFFVLFEAYKDRESLGCRLGRFGSVVVADPIFAELNNRLQSERHHGSLAEQLRSVHPAFGDPNFDRPVTMATVIRFIDRHLQAGSDLAMRYPSLL